MQLMGSRDNRETKIYMAMRGVEGKQSEGRERGRNVGVLSVQKYHYHHCNEWQRVCRQIEGEWRTLRRAKGWTAVSHHANGTFWEARRLTGLVGEHALLRFAHALHAQPGARTHDVA
ncbi:hypothetical protein GUJ93_ZPchr0012g20855 [Zizania palustris]|uniref:Uncharacterized protein n=1 Tax=Zizania palustris TaxID=103762 RepID=A0A8J5WQP5_ZIZPA|nr:hypothetical protein GUJ93_ZPchr0012g20855 [Zizania palustris]